LLERLVHRRLHRSDRHCRSVGDVLPDALVARLTEALQPAETSLSPIDASTIRERLHRRIRSTKAITTVQPHEGEWQPFSPKVMIKVLRRDVDTQSYLLKLEAGATLLQQHIEHTTRVLLESNQPAETPQRPCNKPHPARAKRSRRWKPPVWDRADHKLARVVSHDCLRYIEAALPGQDTYERICIVSDVNVISTSEAPARITAL